MFCDCRGLRRSVALILGGSSRKALRGQQRQRCTLLNLSPKKEKSWARPAPSGQSRRSGGSRVGSVLNSSFILVVWDCGSPLQSVETMKKEMDVGDAGPYRAPPQLRKRSDFSSKGADSSSRVFEANEWVTFGTGEFSYLPSRHTVPCLWMLCHSPSLITSRWWLSCREAMGVVLHKDSKWYQQWKDFKDNNVVFNSKSVLLIDYCMSRRFDELWCADVWCFKQQGAAWS